MCYHIYFRFFLCQEICRHGVGRGEKGGDDGHNLSNVSSEKALKASSILLPIVEVTFVTIYYYPSLSINSLPIPVFSKHTKTRYNFKRNFTKNKGKTKSKGKENKELEQSNCRQCLCYSPAFGA